jgi:hypothetical protein
MTFIENKKQINLMPARFCTLLNGVSSIVVAGLVRPTVTAQSMSILKINK